MSSELSTTASTVTSTIGTRTKTTTSTMATSAATFNRTGRSTSTSRANVARLPSLKQLSDRLGPKENEKSEREKDAKDEEKNDREQQKPALSEITTITTNVPIAAPTPVVGSRLKLPASAVARANLSPDGTRSKKDGQMPKSSTGKPEKAPRDTKPAETQSQAKTGSSSAEPAAPPNVTETAADASPAPPQDATDLAKASKKGDHQDEPALTVTSNPADDNEKRESDDPKDDTKVQDNQGKPDVHRTVRALGMGRPGIPSTPPSRGDSMVPDIVVQSSTPGKGEVSEEMEQRAAAALAAGQHPLAHSWTLYYDSKTYKPDPAKKKADLLNPWEASLLHVGTFDTVEGFARHMNNIRLPSGLGKGANYHLFKDGIKPLWEDPANKNGGKWVMLVRGQQSLIDSIWSNLCMALVGQILDPMNSVCGIVVSARPKMDRVQVWTRGRDDYPALNALASRVMLAMALEPREQEGISLEFNSNKPGDNISDSKLLRITPNTRSASVASLPNDSPRPRNNRLPSTPVNGSPVMMNATMPLPSPVPRGVSSSLPLRRTSSGLGANGGSSNPFAGPLGVVRGGRLGNAAN